MNDRLINSDTHLDVGKSFEQDNEAGKRDSKWKALFSFKKGSGLHILGVFIVLEVVCIVVSLLFPSRFPYLSSANIRVSLEALPNLGIVSLGVGVLMIAGEFDLSVGANYTFTAIVMASLASGGHFSPYIAALVALGLGVGIGLLNSVLTFGIGIPSFIATLGASLFWEGFTLFYHGANFQSFTPSGSFAAITAGSLGIFPSVFLWFVGLAIGLWLIIHLHRVGNHIFAVGADAKAAEQVGVKPRRTKTFAFAIAGLTAALSGILATARTSSIVPGQGASLPLDAIAACVIGGLALMGGQGTILGVFLGAAMIYTIQDILLLAGAPGFYLQLFVGLLIIAAAGFNQRAGRRARG